MTQQDLQGIADQVAPGSQVRDPELFAQFLAEQAASYSAQTGEPPENAFLSLFNRTVGRGIGAVGRGTLGAGRFLNENAVQPLEQYLAQYFARRIAPAIPNLDPNQPGLDPQQRQAIRTLRSIGTAADQYSAATGSAVAQQFAPLLSAQQGIGSVTQLGRLEQGLPPQPNSFDAFIADLQQRRQGQPVLDALTLRSDREAFSQSDIPAKFAFEAAGDVTNLIPGEVVARGLGLAGREAAERAAAEGLASVARTGAREIPTAAERGAAVAERSAAREAARPVIPFGPNRTTEGVPGGIPAGAAGPEDVGPNVHSEQLRNIMEDARRGLQDGLGVIRDHKLSRYADTVYRETNPDRAEQIISGKAAGRTLGDIEDIFVSNTPKLALGQHENKGVLLELSTNGLSGRLNLDGPGLRFVAMNDAEAEFRIRGLRPGQLSLNVRAVTVKPGVELSDATTRALSDPGWQRTVNPDGSTTYRFQPQVYGRTPQPETDLTPPPGTAPRGPAPEGVRPAALTPDQQLEAEVSQVRTRLADAGIPPRTAPQAPLANRAPLTPEQQLEQEVAAARGRNGGGGRGTRGGSVPPSGPNPEGTKRVISLIRLSKRLRPTVEEAIREQRRAGAEAGREAASRQATALGRTRAFIGGQAGRTTSQAKFEPVGEAIPGTETLAGFPDLTPTQASQALGVTPQDFEGMFAQVENALPDRFEAADAQRGLIRLLTGNTATPRQAKFLEQVFGREMAEAATKRTPLSALRRAGDVAYDLTFLLPKTLRSSWDASAPLRQAVIYTLNPRPSRLRTSAKAFSDMIKVGFARPGEAEATARDLYARITNPAANRWAETLYGSGPRGSRLYLQNPDQPILEFTKREEYFASRLAEALPDLGRDFKSIRGRAVPRPVQRAVSAATLPVRVAGSGVRRSELMFGTYLNEVRNSVATRVLNDWDEVARRTGRPITDAEVQELRRGINIFTGRGELGPLENSAKFFSGIFWSPRLAAARIETPFFPLRGLLDPTVRRASAEMAKDLVAFTLTGTTILYLIDSSGAGKVELDPRSPNFGKIRVGNRTFDFWGGFQQMVRYTTQLITGERKTVSGQNAGQIEETLPKDTIFNFLRSKISPGLPTLAGNEAAGRTFNQEPIRQLSKARREQVAAGLAPSPNEIRIREAAQQYAPLFAIDLSNAVRQSGAGTAAEVLPGVFGVGVQTFDQGEEPSATVPTRSNSGLSGLKFK